MKVTINSMTSVCTTVSLEDVVTVAIERLGKKMASAKFIKSPTRNQDICLPNSMSGLK
jgi:hypothetical protein